MQFTTLGDSDLSVSHIGLGTMTFGEQNSECESFALLDHAVVAGINFIDTAEMYPVYPKAETYGASECIIGRWLNKTGNRDKLVIATKVAGPSRSLIWIRNGALNVTGADIIAACDASLKRLQTDYIDLYQIHWPNRKAPIFGQLYFDPVGESETCSIEEQLEALQCLHAAGKIRYVGVSNETAYGVGEFVRLAEVKGLPRIVSVQNAYNLLNRSVENGIDESLHRYGLSLLAYSPLAFGRLTMKYENGAKIGQATEPRGRLDLFPVNWSPRYLRPEVAEACEHYRCVASDYGLTLTQLALAFCYRNSKVSSTVIGSTTLEQLQQCLNADQVMLPLELLAEIDAIRWKIRDPAQ
jgi:aryl-alcohol dehydrogenase-like predicted oxidoreductase